MTPPIQAGTITGPQYTDYVIYIGPLSDPSFIMVVIDGK